MAKYFFGIWGPLDPNGTICMKFFGRQRFNRLLGAAPAALQLTGTLIFLLMCCFSQHNCVFIFCIQKRMNTTVYYS